MFIAATARRLLLSVLTLAGLLAFNGCSSPASSSPTSGQNSIRTLTTSGNTHWVLANWTSSDGQKHVATSPAPTLSIGYQGRITGNAGVNNYMANVTVADDVLNWGSHIGATRMAGTPEAMEAENRFLDDLKSTQRVTIRGSHLIFTGEKPLRLEFTRAYP